MSRYGKCQNFSGCLLAYRGEETEVEDDQPFICAECGKPLTQVGSPSAMWLRYGYAVAGVIVLGVIIIFSVPSLRSKILGSKKPSAEEAPSSSEVVSEPSTTPDTTANTAPQESSAPVAEPPPTVVAPEQIDLNLGRQENRTVKAEVLTRVDLMPVSTTNKDKLYSAVEKARSMGKILTVPFASGKTEISAVDLQAMKAELDKPEIVKLRDEATTVFVVLGFADPKGDAKKNLAISTTRAESVMKAMKEKLEVLNLIHTVGMGGSKLVDAQNLEKNRIVEIWAVQP